MDSGPVSSPPSGDIPDSEVNAYAALMQQSNIAVALTDSVGRYRRANRRWLEMLGYSEDELLHLTVQHVTHRDSLHTIEENAVALAAGASQFLNHKKYVRKDGSVFWANTTISALRDRSGQLVGYLALIADLTAQRQGRLLVDSQNEALQLVISSAPLERVFERLIALVEAEAEGDAVGVVCLLDPVTRRLKCGAAPSLPEAYKRIIDGQPIGPNLITCAAAAARNEVVITPDLATAAGWAGQLEWPLQLGLRAAWSMPIVCSAGKVLGTFGTYFRRCRGPTAAEIDMMAVLVKTAALAITRREAEDHLRAAISRTEQQKRLYETVLSNTPDLVYVFDLNYRFTYANPALLEMWGRTADQAIGKSLLELGYEPWHAERHEREIDQVVATKLPVRGEVAFTGTRGPRIYDYIFAPVLGVGGRVEAVTGTTRDITDQNEAAAALRAARDEALTLSRAKDDFLAALSHELRTPLNPILLIASQAMANPRLAPDVRADFETIASSVTLEARLIDDLLDVTRMAHHPWSMDCRPLDLSLLVRRVIAAMQPELRQKRIALAVRGETVPAVVVGDEVRLQQILWNLIKNAVKFTPAEGRIAVTIQESTVRRGFIAIEVSDTGIGLTEAELRRVFEPFVQGDHGGGGGISPFGGLGLGLAISRKIVTMHSGFISAQSAGRDRGATFLVELPQAGPESAGTGLNPARSGAAFASAGGEAPRCVLVVEDHDPSRIALARLLASRKLEVWQAASAQAARDLAEAHRFDLVISDLGLPDGSGRDLMKELRVRHGCRGIALSGYGSATDVAESEAAGFLAHLIKPVQAQDLDRILAAVQSPAGESAASAACARSGRPQGRPPGSNRGSATGSG